MLDRNAYRTLGYKHVASAPWGGILNSRRLIRPALAWRRYSGEKPAGASMAAASWSPAMTSLTGWAGEIRLDPARAGFAWKAAAFAAGTALPRLSCCAEAAPAEATTEVARHRSGGE